MSPRGICILGVCLLSKSKHNSDQDFGFGVQKFSEVVSVMLHWGTLGPTVNLFSTFSTLLKYKMYSFVCSCKHVILSFEV